MEIKRAEKFLPLTHTTYYTLLALEKPLHGYGIMQIVEEISGGLVKLGPGTLYGALKKLEKQSLISKVGENDSDRRILYVLTDFGKEVVILEYKRLTHLVNVSESIVNRIGGKDHD